MTDKMRDDKGTRREVGDMLVLILQIGITMLVPIVMCTVGGAWLDNRWNTRYIGLTGFVLGAAAGFQNVYRLVRRYLKDTRSPGEIQRDIDRENEDDRNAHEDIADKRG